MRSAPGPKRRNRHTAGFLLAFAVLAMVAVAAVVLGFHEPMRGVVDIGLLMAGMPPVAGAKIQLLRRLEESGSCEAVLLAEELLEARTLKDLAHRAHGIAIRLRETDGAPCAEAFWNASKAVLLRWRDFAPLLRARDARGLRHTG
jgi:hypothetical protein